MISQKKGIVLVLLVLFVTGLVFAAGASISRTSTSLTVKNTNVRGSGAITGEICITLKRVGDASGWTTEDWWTYGPINPGKTDTYRVRTGLEIVTYSDSACIVVPEQ
jgi:hypothetical protein